MVDHPAEVNKLELGDDPPDYVLKAVREENERFRNDFRTHGPRVVSLDTLKPRLRAAMAQAIKEHDEKQQG